jgi:hypothetical protein
MNMKDPEGKTHHVMATFMRDGKAVEEVVGKVKLISPSGKEQLADLKSFGSGIYAANFLIDEPGKWGGVRGVGLPHPLPGLDFFFNLSYKIVHFRAYFRYNIFIYSAKYFTKRHHLR